MQAPTVFTTTRFDECLGLARTSTGTMKEAVMESLIIACFFAFKDGNTTPLNAVLDMAVNSKAIDQKRITMWVELHAGIARIKKEQFVLNKKVRDDSAVTNAESFAPFEVELRKVMWYDIMGKTKATSVFEIDRALEQALKSLVKHAEDPDTPDTPEQFAEAIKAIKAIKGKIAQMAITESETQDDGQSE